jgi:UPF0755 protein
MPTAASKRFLRVGLLVGLLIGIALLAWVVLGWTGAGPAKAATPVVIAQGSSMAAAARSMEEAGVLASADSFLLQARLFGGDKPIRAGEYEVPAGASPSELLQLLQSGRVLQRFVIVPEGLPSVMVHDRLMQAPFLTGAVAVPEEGSVLPDSYSYQRGESRAAVLKRMKDAMTKELDALWAKRKPGLPIDTKQEAVTLASIVEKETGKPSERRMVAGVMTNRLRIGMMLGADATTIYPITKGRPLGRMIRVSELRDRNPYNTRAVGGLPPGPITNPGREAIAAVLDPAETDALYYVADGTGGHVFSRTLQEHNANAERWRALRRARGEM